MDYTRFSWKHDTFMSVTPLPFVLNEGSVCTLNQGLTGNANCSGRSWSETFQHIIRLPTVPVLSHDSWALWDVVTHPYLPKSDPTGEFHSYIWLRTMEMISEWIFLNEHNHKLTFYFLDVYTVCKYRTKELSSLISKSKKSWGPSIIISTWGSWFNVMVIQL